MLSPTLRTRLIRGITLMGIAINVSYAAGLITTFLAPTTDNAARDILVSAISLELAWAVLLSWIFLKPLERYSLLLLNALAMLFANGLHSLGQFLYQGASFADVATNLGPGTLIASVFAYAYWLGRTHGGQARK